MIWLQRQQTGFMLVAVLLTWGVAGQILDSDLQESAVSPAFAQTDDDSEPSTVEIGALIPLTLNDSEFERAKYWEFAINTAVSDFNDYLVANDATWNLTVDIRDTLALSNTTVELVTDMQNDDIKFVVGPAFSGNVGAIITDYIEPDSELVLVSPSSTSVEWALEDNVYRLAIADDKQSQATATLLYNEGKRVIIPVWANDPFGNGLAKATSEKFEDLGGVADYDDGMIRSYDRCSETYTTCIEDQFPNMARELSDTVTKFVRSHGSDKIAIMFIGFELSEFVTEAYSYPILQTVKWVGSDANVLESNLINTQMVSEFLTTAEFRAPIFSISGTTDRHAELTDRFALEFPGSEPSIYTYSSYDSVWAIGLAIEAAGGPDSEFNDIAAQIKPAVDGNDQGALGDIMLNQVGDIASGNYDVWGIVPTGWEQIGTFRAGGTFGSTYDNPVNVRNIGALLSVGGAQGVYPAVSEFLDQEMAVTMSLAELDFNNSHPEMQINVNVIDTNLGTLPALNELQYGAYDDFYKPQLLEMLNNAIARYDEQGTFDSLEGMSGPTMFTVGFDRQGLIDFLSIPVEPRPQHLSDIAGSYDRSLGETYAILTHDSNEDDWQPPSHMWGQFSTSTDNIRILLTYHAPTDLVLGAGYFTPAGNDDTHEPSLELAIQSAIQVVQNNDGDLSSLEGTYDDVSSPFYAFVIDTDGLVLSTSLEPTPNNNIIGLNISELNELDSSIGDINDSLLLDGDTTWIGYVFNNPHTGIEEQKRSLLMQVTINDTEYIFGSGYYMPANPIRNFVGPTTSSNLASVMDHINTNDYTAISQSSTATSLAADDNVFRLQATNAAQIPALINQIKLDGNEHLVIIQRDDVWAEDLVNLLIMDGSFESYKIIAPSIPVDGAGFSYTRMVTYVESDISTVIKNVGGNASSVAVIHVLFPEDIIALLEAASDIIDSDSPLYSVNHYTTDAITNMSSITDNQSVGKLTYDLGLKGILFTSPLNETSTSLSERLESMGIPFVTYHSSAYDAVWLTAKSMLMSSDQHSVADVLSSMQPNGTLFPYAGALNDNPGITLDMSGDLATQLSDFATFVVTSSNTGYSWQQYGPIGTVSGIVYADVDRGGRLNPGDYGIPDVTIVAQRIGGNSTMIEAVTNPDGSFVITNLEPGLHAVTAIYGDDKEYGYVTVDAGQIRTINLGFK